jgi:hypothetical protein
MEKYILITWQPDKETVVAQLGPNPTDDEILETKVYYPAQNQRLSVTTRSTRVISADGSHRISIHYSPENNPHLVNNPYLVGLWGQPDAWYWGTSTITVNAGLDTASAVWTDRRPQYNGQALQCTVFPPAPLAERDREVVSRIKRSQADFKEYLFVQDRCCAISGESTAAALESAHIVAAAANGLESPDNGILLGQTFTACTTLDSSKLHRIGMAP